MKNWYEKTIGQKKQLRGYNSYIANEPKYEFQIDLFFISKKEFSNEKYIGGVLCIDIFSKFTNFNDSFTISLNYYIGLFNYSSL
jgi:hypothetical protein